MDTQNTALNDSEIVFTPAAVLDLLASIEEFNEFELSLTETMDGGLQLQVGDSYYELSPNSTIPIKVDNSIVDTIQEINSEAYEDIDGEDANISPIESGLIKETLKTLLIGGVVRLAKDYLKN